MVRDISVYTPDHKLFDAKAALYIARTISPSIMGLNYEVLASFEGLLKPITTDKRKIQDLWKAFWVVFSILYKERKSISHGTMMVLISRHTVMCQRPRKMCGTQMYYLQELLSHYFQYLISL